MFNILLEPAAGPKHKGILYESGLIHLDNGEFTHIQHEKFMGKAISLIKEEERKEEEKPLPEVETTPAQSSPQPKTRNKRK